MKTISRIEMIKASTELNFVMGLNPPISLDCKELQLKELILKASTFILPKDNLTYRTLSVIKNILNEKGEKKNLTRSNFGIQEILFENDFLIVKSDTSEQSLLLELKDVVHRFDTLDPKQFSFRLHKK